MLTILVFFQFGSENECLKLQEKRKKFESLPAGNWLKRGNRLESIHRCKNENRLLVTLKVKLIVFGFETAV
ncbi:hypothetical protein DLM78_15325 [Leptospira stimsonii]|uniref:Uncharacterized protein n=1 Tax=Leptospira stimsonii TaxID=2202203 RepID=A0A8B3CNH3_9LEPT|nr:hypothetical protein DLM78_15325 [Leptospira stimsonii]